MEEVFSDIRSMGFFWLKHRLLSMLPEKKTSPEQDRGGRRGRTGVTKGGPHVLVRRKQHNSDGEDGTEGDGGGRRGRTVVTWRRRGGGRYHTE
ncbi:hypothetical protein HanXRQr2_Chr16g0759211 [Helianthus annuus]|uniref:Uncharacterized protein n=1 Tax=Helianthus annuus TaxID=4232 RepID=A0A9K3GZI7_HELAN|nr:hypothetical protein HanXRQr2_Chr16g0759211 [Helianthus annuus]KAJ0822056.1 hypothetical protein HanPSC8_Chr16g0727521 [Helianthus annuus]